MSSRYTTLIAALVLVVAAIGLTSRAVADDTDPKEQKQEQKEEAREQPQEGELPVLLGIVVAMPIPGDDVELPRGARYDAEIDSADEIRSTLAAVTEAALSKDTHGDVVDLFVDMDRNRLEAFEGRDLTTLEGRLAQINQAFKDKYGQEFDIAENAVYGPLAFAEGEITDASQFVKSWPVGKPEKSLGKSPEAGVEREEADDPAMEPGDIGEEESLTTRMQTQGNLENGREFAVARFPAEFGLPPVNVSFIDEAFGLKIDLPNEIDGEQLRTNLLEQMTKFGESSDEWPVGVLDAYRLASHHVAMALYGVEVPQPVSAR